MTRVSMKGDTSGGTTTYPVTVRIDETDGLRPGMNANAEIVVAQAKNALAVPNAAVVRGSYVLVTQDSPSAVNADPTWSHRTALCTSRSSWASVTAITPRLSAA